VQEKINFPMPAADFVDQVVDHALADRPDV
jgi:hypothetical protein